jgi:protoporphyrinogen oxidase
MNTLIVLGGGLAGLAVSMDTGAPIYEAQAAPGGVAASDTVDGFVFDRGIHILQTKNIRVLNLLSDLGVPMESHSRNAFIYSNETYTAYPFQVNTAGLPWKLRARCVWEFLRRNSHPPPRTYEDWMNRSLGTGFAKTFLIPYSEKFWTVHPREMTFEWTGNRVPQPSLAQVIRGALWSKQTRIGTNVDFRYPIGQAGYGAIAQALLTRCGPVHVGHRAVALDSIHRCVHFANGRVVPYRVLVSTIPLPEIVALCPEAPAEVRAAAARLRTNSIFVVNFGVDRPRLSDRHWVHFPEPDISFFRISYPHTFGRGTAPPGMSSISAEIAYSRERLLDRQTIIERVRQDLIRVGALGARDRIVTTSTYDIRYGYCIYDMNRKKSVATIHEWLKANDIIPAGRYGLWTYFWSDEAILSGKKAAERAMKQVARLTSTTEPGGGIHAVHLHAN